MFLVSEYDCSYSNTTNLRSTADKISETSYTVHRTDGTAGRAGSMSNSLLHCACWLGCEARDFLVRQPLHWNEATYRCRNNSRLATLFISDFINRLFFKSLKTLKIIKFRRMDFHSSDNREKTSLLLDTVDRTIAELWMSVFRNKVVILEYHQRHSGAGLPLCHSIPGREDFLSPI